MRQAAIFRGDIGLTWLAAPAHRHEPSRSSRGGGRVTHQTRIAIGLYNTLRSTPRPLWIVSAKGAVSCARVRSGTEELSGPTKRKSRTDLSVRNGRVTLKLRTAFLLCGISFSSLSSATDQVFIQTVEVHGTQRQMQLETKAESALDRTKLARDVRRIWDTGWFEDIHVEANKTLGGVELAFEVVEKPRLYLRRVEFQPAAGRYPVRPKAGTLIDAQLARGLAETLRQELVEDGYADARVTAKLVPVRSQEADLHIQVNVGRPYRVEKVRLSGTLRMKQKEVRGALRSARIRRLLPGIPGLWNGWQLRPIFSKKRVETDLQRLRSLYLSHGYFDAEVSLAGLQINENNAKIDIAIEAGPHYQVRGVSTALSGLNEGFVPPVANGTSVRELCRCLLRARRQAENEGRLDFAARLEVRSVAAPPRAAALDKSEPPGDAPSRDHALSATRWVDLTSRFEGGPAYSVGRIEFRGHSSISDETLRRAMLLQEGQLFDRRLLRRSLGRLNRTGLIETVTENDVWTARDPENGLARLTIQVRERPRGRWSLSGPAGPVSLFGPLGFSISSRLPSWGTRRT